MGFYDRISKAKKEYVEGWKNDSKYFCENDYYKWMCSFISDKEHVLEIGCGSGYSTLALLTEGHKVISIDVNKECLFATKALLEMNGYKGKVIERGTIIKGQRDFYSVEYTEIQDEVLNKDFLLVEGEIIGNNDPNLIEWLVHNDKFDAVVCWMIGVYGYQFNNTKLKEVDIFSDGNISFNYRLATQNRVYEISDIILKVDGILSVVDRAPKLSENTEKELRRCHEEQASVTTLKVSDVSFIDYDVNKIIGGIRMARTQYGKVPIFKNTDMSLVAIKAIKV